MDAFAPGCAVITTYNIIQLPNTRNVASGLVWWVGIVASFSKIILNQCNCWAGSVLCQVCFF